MNEKLDPMDIIDLADRLEALNEADEFWPKHVEVEHGELRFVWVSREEGQDD